MNNQSKAMEEDENTELHLSNYKSFPAENSFHEANIELKKLRSSSFLAWFFIDQSSFWRKSLSWSLFFLLTIGVPLFSHFVFACSRCDEFHIRPFDAIIQLSLSLFATISFISVSSFTRKYGLRKFLFLDKLSDESEKVRQGYTLQVHSSMKILSAFVIPCFLADSVYKTWWLASGGTQIPYVYNVYLSHIIVCILLMSSWLYRTSISFLVCVLFRLICFLQILRLEDFAQVFEKDSDVAFILLEHLRIRRNLRIISHRFRGFILLSLILVTASQFVSLLVTTASSSTVNIFTAGELAVILHFHLFYFVKLMSFHPFVTLTSFIVYTNVVSTHSRQLCSITLVTGLFICLRSAAKITHKAQSVTSLAAKWHVCSTINSFDDDLDDESPRAQIAPDQAVYAAFNAYFDTDNEEGDGDDEIDNTNLVPILHTISYQKRQALVTYFEHNRAGITVYGFMLDRSWLHTIFAIQLSLTLWILNKTIGIS